MFYEYWDQDGSLKEEYQSLNRMIVNIGANILFYSVNVLLYVSYEKEKTDS